jgi:hypothetical protein
MEKTLDGLRALTHSRVWYCSHCRAEWHLSMCVRPQGYLSTCGVPRMRRMSREATWTAVFTHGGPDGRSASARVSQGKRKAAATIKWRRIEPASTPCQYARLQAPPVLCRLRPATALLKFNPGRCSCGIYHQICCTTRAKRRQSRNLPRAFRHERR